MNRHVSMLAKVVAISAIAIAVLLAGRAVQANDIVEVQSPGGIVAWLKQEPSIPIIAMDALWIGAGSAGEPLDKAGRANLLSAMLDEGAGEMDSQSFQQALDDQAIRLGFDAARDSFSMSLETLSENADAAFEMAGLALAAPRFDAKPLDRMRAATLNRISRDGRNPNAIAGRAFSRLVFADDRYGAPVDGTAETVATLTAEDLRTHWQGLLTRGNLIVGVVGDISPEALGPLLDKAFGALPAEPDLAPGAPIAPLMSGTVKVIEHASPQTVYVFGLPGLTRDDPDYDIARVMNHMLGGGGFSSLLTDEIREKRGLTYGVYSYLRPMDRTGLWLGGLATSNDKAAEALSVLKETIAGFRETGPDADRLSRTKANINGAFPLRFTSNNALARLLVAIQRYDLGKDYVEKRPERINAITLADVRRVADRLLDLDRLTVVAVGRPDGVANTATE